jgi:diacylglycerol kinase family enzyme
LPKPRLRLIVNPVASNVRERSVRTVLAAFEPYCDVAMVETARHEHGIELAAEAVELGFDGVCAMGGDGTANEVLNGAGDRIPIGVLPAGGTSVLPRALRMPRDIGAAARRIGSALAEGRERHINLGTVNGRRFAFASGVGADAQAVRLVDEAGRPKGKRPGDAYFAAQIMRTLLRGDFREPQIEVSMNGEVVARGGSIFAANVHPWSYVGPFALKLAPLATFEGGLDVVVPSDLHRRHLPRYAAQLLVTGSQAYRTDKRLVYLHDVDEVQVTCTRPLPLHADGDDLGDVEAAVFGVARDAARMLV